MPFSVIIPAHNAAGTLAQCIGAIHLSRLKPDEIIVVNDGSSDRTPEIAAALGCRVIQTAAQEGAMPARFAGAREASFPKLVFLDSDVLVYPDTFEKFMDRLDREENAAVVATLSRKEQLRSFSSNYKNEYMSYIFSKQPEHIDFIYGSAWAIRKEDLVEFVPTPCPYQSPTADSELGFYLTMNGKRILLDRSIQVVHIKRYSLFGLLKNDFVIPFAFAHLLPKHLHWKGILTRKAFSHVSAGQTVMTCASLAGLFSLILAIVTRSPLFFYTALTALVSFYVYWARFFRQVAQRGPVFLLKTLLLKPIDAAVMAAGLSFGLLRIVRKPAFKGAK